MITKKSSAHPQYQVNQKDRQRLAPITAELFRGCDSIITQDEIIDKIISKKVLKIKVGFDPTAPDLHLGHTVIINKMRQWQEFGHQVSFLIGDFTGMIGDPSGKNTTRPPLSKEEIIANAQTYKQQIFKILNPDKTKIEFNSKWSIPLGAEGLIRLASTYTVARIIERDDFSSRLKNNQPIAMHELFYPLMQGYDSVAMQTDVEMGGSDQRFNLLIGRELQRHFNHEPQSIMTMPLLVGVDGVNKMSKSLGNYISINEPARDIFGKLMSISDELMWSYFKLLSHTSINQIVKWQKECEQGHNPRDFKIILAKEITARFHSKQDAEIAHLEFEARAKQKIIPTNIPKFQIHTGIEKNPNILAGELFKRIGLAVSTSEYLRKVAEGGVRINGDKVSNKNLSINIFEQSELIAQIGKHRFIKVEFVE